jgi:hypothetical protein
MARKLFLAYGPEAYSTEVMLCYAAIRRWAALIAAAVPFAAVAGV